VNKIFSFYLPQYHRFKENDDWWGQGFTEWTNVVKQSPRFSGHNQPQLPADMGFYDLRVEDTRKAQSDLAKNYGIDGFIYYHYWFHGKRLMEQPFDQMFNNKDEDFPFALCWANETWTRAWDGLEREILIKQEYSESDDIAHIDFLVERFKDERYIKVDGNPLFLIYRIGNHPQPEKFIKLLREKVVDSGFKGVYLSGVKSSFSKEVNQKILNLDLDLFVDFQPNSEDFPVEKTGKTKLYDLLKKYLPDSLYQSIKLNVNANKVIDYEALVDNKVSQSLNYFHNVAPCVFPSWDNSARRNSATIIQNNNGTEFKKWLTHAKKLVENKTNEEQIVFINAWNEWAEGCHLEPDTKNGKLFLECVKEIKNKN
jgi:lipopolysaccharide biosynthesis protein